MNELISKVRSKANISKWEIPLKKVIGWVEERNYRGYDVYDGLKITNSQFILNNKIANPALTQFFKKSPINFRSIFDIEQTKMPKSMGLFLHAYVNLAEISARCSNGNAESGLLIAKADRIKSWLILHSLTNYSGAY